MVTETSKAGLIVSTDSQRTAALDELIARCAWPALLAANAERLDRELKLQSLQWLVFWLEDRRHVAPTVKLLAWLHQRGPKPYHIVLAYRLEDDVEPMIRAAGVHFFLPAAGDIAAVVEDALWPLLERERLRDDAAAALGGATALPRAPPNLGTFPELSRPP